MKISISIFPLFLLFSFLKIGYVLGQCDPVGITTNPASPINPEKPSKLNTFNWQAEIYDVNSPFISNSQIASPFYQIDNVQLSKFSENRDRLSEDGWELINYKTGYLPDGTTDPLFDGYIYLILYNKHTGMLRVFYVGSQVLSYTGAKMTISFNEDLSLKQTSLLSNVSLIFALDQFESAPIINAAMPYNNNGAKWFYADFQMTYDPCTCLFESSLKIDIWLIDESVINLTGSLEGTLTNISNSTGSVGSKASGYSFKELASAGVAVAQKAQKTYSSANKFVTTQFEALKTEGKTEAQLIAEGKLELANKVRSLNQFQTILKSSNFLQQGLKAFPYVGAAVELIDFFVSGGKKSPSPQEVKIMPMSIQADMKLSGTLTANYNYGSILFHTPGSANVATRNDDYYPLYNEVLGVFNLLETPVLKYRSFAGGGGGSSYYVSQTYQLMNLNYVLNPAAGFNLSESEIFVSLEFSSFSTTYVSISCIGSFSVRMAGGTAVSCFPIANLKSVNFLLNLKRNDADANTQNVLVAVKYPYKIDNDQAFGFNSSYCDWENTLSSQNRTLSGTYKAWDNITIGQGTILQPGTIIQAGNSIDIEQGVTIPQGVTLKLGLPTDCVDTGITPATSAEVTAFCNSAKYNDPSRTAFRVSGENSTPKSDITELVDGLSLYPNPTKGIFTIDFGTKIQDKVEITIFNATGGIVHNVVLENTASTVIDLRSKPKGMYLIKVKNTSQIETRKIMLE